MKFLTCVYQGEERPAILKGERVVLLSDIGYAFSSVEETARFSTVGQLADMKEKILTAEGIDRREVTVLPVIPRPYQEIIVMENNFIPDGDPLPTYYYKKASFSNIDGGRIPVYPGHVTQLDYQVEICAVVRGDVYQASRQEAAEHIFGYLLVNNVIARNLTVRHRRPYIATSLDGFLPMGSLLVTPDEMPKKLGLRSYVNGDLRQSADYSQVKFDFSFAISDLSRISVLRGGSIISSGTPLGTGLDQNPPRFLSSGDIVTVEADGLGHLTNLVE